MLGWIQDFVKRGSNLRVLKEQQAGGVQGACSPRTFLNLERQRCHFLDFQGEFEAKRGFDRTHPTTPRDPPQRWSEKLVDFGIERGTLHYLD